MDGVYQCSYHSLFDCDPDINIFYTWSTNSPQIITAEFSVPIQTVNVITYSPRSTSNTVMVQISPQQERFGSGTRTLQHTETRTTNFEHNNIMIPLLFEVYRINPLIITTSSGVSISRIIFCSRNGQYTVILWLSRALTESIVLSFICDSYTYVHNSMDLVILLIPFVSLG